ncbi:MAG: calcium/sodium antiporter [Firmicutes bacterium]|nr:calcium/sodium antiporter [Bacillota bacterium]MBQ3122662.1 calcium/sodium antiporter [Bacillota bacterium]MBQ9972784.1 calcium/sodium antiporter [Bacillota bacterium]
MDLVINLVLLVVGFVCLVKGADWFVEGASGIALKFGIPQLVIGLTIVAMGTSAPEAAVSISAAAKGSAAITIGNIVGSNIMNVLVILGISSVIVPLKVAKSTVKVEMPFVIAITVMLLLLGLDGTITFIDGLIILAVFAVYLGYLFWMAKKGMGDACDDIKECSIGKAIAFTIVGMALIVLGSNVAVDAATSLATIFGLSERFIGLTVVALGTSLPELFTSVTAARKGNDDIAIGNIVGSNIFNILFVVGLSSVIIPVPFAGSFRFDFIIATAAVVFLWICCLKNQKLKRPAGIAMLLGYVAYFLVLWFK